jgi:hypothetical protein
MGRNIRKRKKKKSVTLTPRPRKMLLISSRNVIAQMSVHPCGSFRSCSRTHSDTEFIAIPSGPTRMNTSIKFHATRKLNP